MLGRRLVLSLLVLCPIFTQGHPQGYLDMDDLSPAPRFTSRGQTYRAVLGDTLVLPCEIQNVGNYVVLWRRGGDVLTAREIMVTRDQRFRLVEGYNLEIRNVMPQDAGDYVCQISAKDNKDLVHTVEILVPPTIRGQPSTGSMTVRKGGSVTLECKASGNPVPTITWTKKGGTLFGGEKTVEGFSLTLDQVDRHQAGVYQCSANNGVGPPATIDINLTILYPPEIQVERSWVHSGEGYEAQLVCIVHADPPAIVQWHHDSFALEPNDRRKMETKGTKHTLSISNVQSGDFGNYSCVADNSLGRAKKYMELSGRPSVVEFKSEPYSRGRDFYNLSWEVTSWPPLEEARLLWRRVQLNETHPMPGKWHDVVLAPNPRTAVVGQVTGDGNKHKASYVIRPLQPGSVYEAVVQARNRFGWGEVSDLHKFYTRGSSESLLEEAANDIMGDAGPHASTKGMASASTPSRPHRTVTPALVLPILVILIAACNFV
ncbi:lachesin-like [Cloeon dipterum]|uniref:lachesin-like n=1 Tax=Cloeon dipterum TaxID=197152 RepID=UPI00322016BC